MHFLKIFVCKLNIYSFANKKPRSLFVRHGDREINPSFPLKRH